MDAQNRFDTKVTFALIRIEYLLFIFVILYFLSTHYSDVRWGYFIFFFVIIDIIGYLPGAIAFRFSKTKRISFIYYITYNFTHSFITILAVSLLWCLWTGPEWALLAMPLHLCGDRALFGNFIKPFATFFEPSLHPAFAKFSSEISLVDTNSESEKGVRHVEKR